MASYAHPTVITRLSTARTTHGPSSSVSAVPRRVSCKASSSANGESQDVVSDDVCVSRRAAVLASLASVTSLVAAGDASAGEVLDGLIKYRDDAKAAYEAEPDDEVLKGQLNFFEKQVDKTRANAEFLDALAPRVKSGVENYTGAMMFHVQDVAMEVDFWTKACGMRVTSDVGSGAERVATLAYGQTSLYADDGGKAALVIKQSTKPPSAEGERTTDVGNILSYIQITVPFGLRVSQIYESGGELLYGFGYFDMRSPGGIPVRGQVATRRDPLEVVALNVKNVREAEKALVAKFGYVAVKPLDTNKYAPKSPPGSRLLAFSSPTKTLGILLQPSRENLRRGDVFDGITVVSGADVDAGADVFADVPFFSQSLDAFQRAPGAA